MCFLHPIKNNFNKTTHVIGHSAGNSRFTTRDYSVLKLFTGFATAALMAW
jgi:hypothetical protein